ncbi:MAG: oligosaccharide flippase family protein [Ruminococcus sp.]|nr:oligosaccharide flippase family protein [Ruminococcus sp.]
MFFRNRLIRDTALLTIMQIFLDTSALLLNVFITRKLGAEAIGILTLTGSFLGLAGILSNGNAFLCTSRLISEELGKTHSNPNKILSHGIKLCLIQSIIVSAVIFVFAETLSERFFSGADMTEAIRFMPVALVSGAVSACLKGWFNAVRKASVSAVGDILEFIIKSAVIIVMTLSSVSRDESSVCRIMIAGIIAGNIFSLVWCLFIFAKSHTKCDGRCSLDFKKYISFAFPIMAGSILTSALSSTNDALIPICLRQNGDSVNQALSLFGIFEAIVIPALFFPSVVLCSMSGIIVSESARASASGNIERLRSLTSRLTQWTLVFAIFASAVLMRFGGVIGELLGGGELAGRMIMIIAPVVPFIYMEIILEALIKGMGLQAFSSLNYLAEYAVRISAVLIFVPKLSFYGIVISYYASNVIGNCARFIKILKHTQMTFKPFKIIAVPVIYAFLTMGAVELLTRIVGADGKSLAETLLFVTLWAVGYFMIFFVVNKVQLPEFSAQKVLCNIDKKQTAK